MVWHNSKSESKVENSILKQKRKNKILPNGNAKAMKAEIEMNAVGGVCMCIKFPRNDLIKYCQTKIVYDSHILMLVGMANGEWGEKETRIIKRFIMQITFL